MAFIKRSQFSLWAVLLGIVICLHLCRPWAIISLVKNNPRTTKLMQIRQSQAKKNGLRLPLRHTWVPLSRISRPLQLTVLTAEDDAFYRHCGIDLQATWDSTKKNLKRKRYAAGGSTITQQVAKNLFLSPKKSLWRKFREAILAVELEIFLPKKRILEIYLNVAEWGKGVFGVEAAARTYFNKSAADLNWEESVALAALLPSPLRHSPVREDRYLTWRKAWVWNLLRMSGQLPAGVGPDTVLALDPAVGLLMNQEESLNDLHNGIMAGPDMPTAGALSNTIPAISLPEAQPLALTQTSGDI